MATQRRPIYWADIITLMRIVFGIKVVGLAWHGQLKIAAIYVLVGIFTDLVDGYVARLEGKPIEEQPNLDLDSICDLVFQICAIIGLGLSGFVAWQIIAVSIVAWSPFALGYTLSRRGSRLNKVMDLITTFSSIGAMILVVYGYVYWGLSDNPIYLGFYALLIIVLAIIKRQRILNWLSV